MGEVRLKILLLGDASNCHVSLAKGLRRLGHDVTVISEGSGWQRTARDIDISRPVGGKLGGALFYGRMRWLMRRELSGYDVVSIHNPNFLSLKPHRIMPVFDRLFDDNRGVFLTALGTDVFFIRECLNPDSPLRYNEWRIGDRPGALALARPELLKSWLTPELVDFHRYVYDRVDGITPILYEYDVSVRSSGKDPEAICHIGLPIDLRELRPVVLPDEIDCVNLFLGRHRDRQAEKGTDLLEQAARVVVDRHPGRARLTIVENRPYAEYLGLLRSAHVLMDQAYSYTPATNALLAMGCALNAVSGGEDDFYDFIGERDNRPVINAQPCLDGLVETLDDVVTHPEAIRPRGEASRSFVARHNECEIVAQRAVDFWLKRLNQLGR